MSTEHMGPTRSWSTLRRRDLLRGGAAAGAGIAGLALVGCGDDDDDSGAGGGGTATPGQSPTATSEPAGSPTPSEKTVKVGLAVEPPNVDPHDSVGGTDDFYISNVFSGLTRYSHDGTTVENEMAESVEIVGDGTEIVFTLREGMTFHDGSPVTAEDVEYSYERLMNPDFRRSKFAFSNVDSVEVRDDRTFVYHMTKPDAAFIVSNYGGLNIVPKAYVESVGKDEFSNAPIGSGPYRLTSRNKGSGAVFERFEDFYRGPAGFAKGVYSIIPEANSRADSLDVGEVDIVSAIPPELVERIRGIDGAEVIANPTNTDTIYSFAMESFPDVEENDFIKAVRDKRVRQAINLAVDKQGIASAIYGEEFAEPYSVTHAGQPFDIGKIYDYDPDRAKALMGEAGYDNVKVSMYQPSGRIPGADKIGATVQTNLRDVGFNPDLQILEFSVFITRLLDSSEPHNDGMIFAWATTGSFTSPFQGADNKWTCRSPYGQYCNEQFDALLDQARTILDEEQRNEVVREAFDLLYEEAPGLWIVLIKEPYGLRSSVISDWHTRVGNNAVLQLEDLVPA